MGGTSRRQMGCQESRIIYEDSEPAQPLEYRHGWIIPPEWEFISEVTEYERKPMSESVYDHESEVGIIR